MSQRCATVKRATHETQIEVSLNLDGQGDCSCEVDVGFLKHMIELFARHARIDLEIRAQGDLEVDDHHLVEDVAIVLGRALKEALGEKKGISRYGFVLLPMDEVLVASAVDLGGRFSFCSDYSPKREKVGDLSTELIHHFFRSLAVEAMLNLHFRFLYPGENEHHRAEAMFKGFARSLRMAMHLDPTQEDEIPSTKGVL